MSEGEKIIGHIENGVIIDHLPVGTVWQVVDLLGIQKQGSGAVSLGDRHVSKKLGSKGFVKIEGRELDQYEVDLVALIAPTATITYIHDGKKADKRQAEIPALLEGVVMCANTNCVTNEPSERGLGSIVRYNAETGIFTCHYCKYEFKREEVKVNPRL